MPFPLNRVVLSVLADNDLFALLSLMDVSNSLHLFILDQVLTSSLLCRFMRENQYVLHHDVKRGELIPVQHVAWLSRAFEALRKRHGNHFYDDTYDFLGPLLSRVPFEAFKTIPRLSEDFSLQYCDLKGRPVGIWTLEDITRDYRYRLESSWIHQSRCLLDAGQTVSAFYDFHKNYSHQYLRQDFLFCARYLSDFNACYKLIDPISEMSENPMAMLDGVIKIMKGFEDVDISLLMRKRCIQGVMEYYLQPYRLERRKISEDTFKALFELPGWMEMWNESELGWWYSLALWQYGPAYVDTYIGQTFKNKRYSLVWLFLGSHKWLHLESTREEVIDHEISYDSCCPTVTYVGFEREYLINLVASTPRHDRIWAMEQIIRRAPEFGVCRNLGFNIFEYFVLHNLNDVDDMMCILLEEVIASPLQHCFEYAISRALTDYQLAGGAPLRLSKARKYGARLLRKDLSLSTLLCMI
jgi:hypothetical protein